MSSRRITQRSMRNAALPALAALTACNSVAAAPPPPVVGVTPGRACVQAPLAQFVGRQATQQVGMEMLAASNSAELRWASIGMMLTMEFREDRVTVRLDRENRILAANCG